MRPDAPKLRSDLTFTRREALGDIIITDSLADRYHQIGEIEQEVFQLFDGERSFADIARYMSKKHQAEVEPKLIEEFAEQAAKLGLLDLVSDGTIDEKTGKKVARAFFKALTKRGIALRPPGAPAKSGSRYSEEETVLIDQAMAHVGEGRLSAAARSLAAVFELAPHNRRARILLSELHQAAFRLRYEPNSFMFYRLPLFNPTKVLPFLDGLVGWAIRPVTALIIPLMLVVAFASLSSVAPRLEAQFAYKAANPASIVPLILPAILLGWFFTLIHELSHGVTCHHFGGRVREIGLLWMGINLGAYCDVSSAYLFQEKWKRVAVTLAGPLMDSLSLCGVILAYHLAPADSVYSRFFAFMILGRVIGLIFAILPFFKDDLYYSISEATSVINLWSKATDTASALAQRYLFGLNTPIPELEPREWRVVSTYGFINLVLTSLMVVRSVGFVLRFAATHMKGFGVLLVFFLLYMLVWRRLAKAGRFLYEKRRELWASFRFRRNALLLTAALTGLAFAPVTQELVTDCTVTHEQELVRTATAGTLLEFKVNPGQQVRRGEVVARLVNPPLEAELARCEAEEAKALAEERQLAVPPRKEEWAASQARWVGARERVHHLEARLEQVETLAHAGAVPETDAWKVAQQLTTARTELTRSSLTLAQKKSGPTADQLAGAEAQLRAVRANCARLRHQVEGLVVRSERSGRVVSHLGSPGPAPVGDRVEQGTELLRLSLDERPARAEVQVPAYAVAQWAQPQTEVEVRLLGVPDHSFPAVVEHHLARAEDRIVPIVARFVSEEFPRFDGASCKARMTSSRAPLVLHLWRNVQPLFDIGFWTLY